MSSTFQDQIGTLQRVIDAVCTLPVRGLVTAGPALDVAALRPASNVTVVASAPHRQVLRQTAVAITHGGHARSSRRSPPVCPWSCCRMVGTRPIRPYASPRGVGVILRRSSRPDAIAAAVRHVLQDHSMMARVDVV